MRRDFRFHLRGKTLVLIDWANVYSGIKKEKWKIDMQRFFDYIKSYSEIEKICIFFGEDTHPKSKEFLKNCEKIGFEVISKEVKYINKKLDNSSFSEKYKAILEIMEENIGIIWNDITHDALKKLDTGEIVDIEKYLSQEINSTMEGKIIDILHSPIRVRKCDFDVEITKEILLNIVHYETFILFSGDGDYAPVIEELLRKEKRVFIVAAKGTLGKEVRRLRENPIHPILLDISAIKPFLIKLSPNDESSGA